MSKTIPHRELRNNSSAVLRDVQAGETVSITNHGEVVAVLVPPPRASSASLRIRRASASVAAKLFVEEPASLRLAARLDGAVDAGDDLLSSMLLETELRRLAIRVNLAQTPVTGI